MAVALRLLTMFDWLRQPGWLLLLTIGLSLVPTVSASGKSYPKDGRFKALATEKDDWYSVDEKNWYIKAPDKWVHFMGSYALTELTYGVVKSKTWAGAISLGLGLMKELDDAYREGWSLRDIYMDVGGVASSVILPDRVKLVARYDDSSVVFRLCLTID